MVEYQYAYTVDGSEPDSSSMLYRRPFDLPVDAVLKMRTFRPNGRGSPDRWGECRNIWTLEWGFTLGDPG